MTKTGNTTNTTNCRRCHGLLTNPRSVTAGIGPTCARRERQDNAARAAGIKPTTLTKARELIADGGIIPIRGRRVFRTVSSDGTRTYLTAPQACSCPAGLKGRTCYHRAAALLAA